MGGEGGGGGGGEEHNLITLFQFGTLNFDTNLIRTV